MVPELLQLASPANVSGAFLSGATSLCIYSGVSWPTSHSGAFRVLIDAEIVRLRGASGLVFPVIERGAEGTLQANHQDYARALHIITAQGAKNLTGGINRQSGATYTFAATDARSLVLFRTSGVALASGSIPQSTSGDTTDFGPAFWTVVLNLGSGDLHLSPASGTINGVAGLTLTGGANKGAFIFSPGTIAGDYAAIVTQMSGGGGASLTSGIIVSGLVGNAAVNSGNIASGAVGWPHFASGSMIGQSGVLINWGVGPPTVGASLIGVSSGIAGSGILASGAVQGFFGTTRNTASGTFGVTDFGSGAVVAGTVGSGAIQSGNIASGQVGWPHHASGFLLAQSGLLIDYSQGPPTIGIIASISSGGGGGATNTSGVRVFVSGVSPITEEIISGVRAVNISQSGKLRVAMAGVSGRMPAIGIVVDNVASGIQVDVWSVITYQNTSGMADYSGWVGGSVFVGRSGQVVTASGSWNSGGFIYTSGDVLQAIGNSFNSGGIVGRIGDAFTVTAEII